MISNPFMILDQSSAFSEIREESHQEVSISDFMDYESLLKIAMLARENAYAPYSGYKVGAALLSSSGKVYVGANVENKSYSATCCAERVALFKAVS